MNCLNATGRIGKDCESRFTPDGTAITAFPLAIDSGYGTKKVTTWLNGSMFGKRGEAVAPYLKKGAQVAVSGELTNREYTDKDGNKRFSLDLRINDLTLVGGKAAPRPEKQPGDDSDEEMPF